MYKRKLSTMASIIIMMIAGLCTFRANAASTEKPIETTIAVTIVEENPPPKPDWNGFLKRCSTSVTVPSAIGTTLGAICAYLENRLGWHPLLSWPFLWGTRNAILHLITNDMKTHSIPHNNKLAFLTARIADWITYLVLKNQLD